VGDSFVGGQHCSTAVPTRPHTNRVGSTEVCRS